MWALNPAAGDAAPAQATPAGPFTLAAAGRDEYVSLSWTPAPVSGPPVRYYSYRRSNDGGSTWTRWSSMWARLPGYPADPLFYQVQNLTNDVEYLFEVQAFNANGQVGEASAPATPTATPGDEIQLLRVSYGTDSYQATEGDSVAVEVRLSPAADRAVDIAITVTADAGTESGDYRVSGLSPGDTLPFAENSASESFHIVALPDPDTDDETVTLGFGPKPPGVLAGTTSSTTVTLVDTTGTSGPLTISGPASVCYDKDRTDAVARYEARDGQANPVPSASWIPSGVDAGAFAVNGRGAPLRPGPVLRGSHGRRRRQCLQRLPARRGGRPQIGSLPRGRERGQRRRRDAHPVSGPAGGGTDSPGHPRRPRWRRDQLPLAVDGFFRGSLLPGRGQLYAGHLRCGPDAHGHGDLRRPLRVQQHPLRDLPARGIATRRYTGPGGGAPSVTDSRPATGASFTLSATVRNQGSGSAVATTLRYYRSANPTIDTGDTQVGRDEVSALAASGTSAESIALTAPAEEGTYYYGACVVAVA